MFGKDTVITTFTFVTVHIRSCNSLTHPPIHPFIYLSITDTDYRLRVVDKMESISVDGLIVRIYLGQVTNLSPGQLI